MEQFHVISILGANARMLDPSTSLEQAHRRLNRHVMRSHAHHIAAWLLRGGVVLCLFLLGRYVAEGGLAVGDDAQCIYTWRGAQYENIRSFPERHPGTRIYKILTNYRSTPPILQMANSVLALQPVDAGYPKELVANRKGTVRPYVVPVMDTRQQAQFLIARIEALYDEGVDLSDIAILYRLAAAHAALNDNNETFEKAAKD